MYQALYRKYRPKTFADVVGQPHVTVTLQNEILSGRIGHAYLFIGSRGTGKTTCAKIFAKAVNCGHVEGGNPCCECEMCGEIDSGEAMDIVELDAASNNGVNDIREICESTAFTPAKAKYRVYIIDEVHMLSAGAFNALLKTLEEPPAHVIFILATTEVHKIPATVLSRCQRFEFHKISAEDIAGRIEYVASQENASITRDAAFLIAKISDGAMRDALAILDKCMGTAKNVTADVVADTVGLASGEQIFFLMQAILRRVPQDALAAIGEFDRCSRNMTRLAFELISRFRDVMLIKTLKYAKKLMVASDDDFSRLYDLAKDVALETVIFIMDTLQASFEKMSRGCDAKTELEMCVIKLCAPQLNCTNEALASRIDELERKISGLTSGIKPEKIPTRRDLKAAKNGELAKELDPRQEKAEFAKGKDSKAIAAEDIEKGVGLRQAVAETMEKGVGSKQVEVQAVEKNANDSLKKTVKDEQEAAGSSTFSVDMTFLHKNAQRMENWAEVLDVLKGYSRTVAMAFNGSDAYISGDFVLIDSKNEMAFELLRKSSQRDKIRDAIRSVTGRAYKLGPYSAEVNANLNAGKSRQVADPLIDLAETARRLGIDVTEV